MNEINSNAKHYRFQYWADKYFKINEEGHLTVSPDGSDKDGNLYKLIQSLSERGIDPPIIIRFNDILKDRIQRLQNAFNSAIEDFSYKNRYQIAYPIKVNPQRHVVEYIQQEGAQKGLALEVGSKPELLAVLHLVEAPELLLLCNGYKDLEYIELALLGRKLGRRVIIIIEQVYEIDLIIKMCEKLNCEAELGFRFRPTNKGTGRWDSSGGDFAKFGLDSNEIIACLDMLAKRKIDHWLKLFHIHIGSQITSIESIKNALLEATCMYAELAKLVPFLEIFDAGGGLGVDYDGSKTTTDSSMNYTVEEYARDVIASIAEACDKYGLKHPTIITESGRALVAHHAVLVTEVVDVAHSPSETKTIPKPPTDHPILKSLYSLYQDIEPDDCLESYHDALELKTSMINSFVQSQLSLLERGYFESVFQSLMAKLCRIAHQLNDIPEEIEKLNKSLKSMYFCNFSVFQSLPDVWAIQQLFPVMPIHRLNEKPIHKAIIADLSCDSDGKIDHFVGYRGIPSTHILLHDLNQEPYYIGIFLIGAYQEILGGLHNLFGDTNVVHVNINEDGNWEVQHVVEGDTIEEVLEYTQYNPSQLKERLRTLIEKSLKAERLTYQESSLLQKKFRQSLENYTYLIV